MCITCFSQYTCGHTINKRLTRCEEAPLCISDAITVSADRDCDDCIRAVKAMMKILRHLQSRTDSTSKLASTAFQAFWPLRDSHLTLKLNGATRQERSRKSEVIEDLKTLDNMDNVDDDKIYEIHLELGKLMRNGKHAASDCFERNDELAKLGGILRGKCERFAEQKTLTENLITEKRDFLVEQLEDVCKYAWKESSYTERASKIEAGRSLMGGIIT